MARRRWLFFLLLVCACSRREAASDLQPLPALDLAGATPEARQQLTSERASA
jgi:hypothetical protein